MGRPRKYTKKSLLEALERYFVSISRTVTLTERVPSGKKDEYGHEIYETKPILNDAGEPIRARQFEIPPTVGGICDYLKIHRSTWADYCDTEAHPEFREATVWARETIHAYLESALLDRAGKDLKGVIFTLQNNYGYAEKREVEMGPGARRAVAAANMTTAEREELLKELAREIFQKDGEAEDG